MNKEAINNQETNYSGKNKFIRNGIFNKRLISILAFIICSLVFLLIVLKIIAKYKPVYVPKGDTVIDYSNIEEVVKYHALIFIGKVNKKVRTKPYDGTGTNIPYTEYEIETITFLKGEGSQIETLNFYGGYNRLKFLEVYVDNRELPIVGQYYIFIVNRVSIETTNKRLKPGDITVSVSQQMIKLNNYNPSLPFSKQNVEIINIINQYLYYIDDKIIY